MLALWIVIRGDDFVYIRISVATISVVEVFNRSIRSSWSEEAGEAGSC